MPSHLHMVVAVEPGTNRLSDIMRDFNKFTAKKIIQSINTIAESRREWLLRHFAYVGKFNPKITDYQFWQEGLHPIELSSFKFIEQKINYIHKNPVEAGVVFREEDYVLSSAAQYAGEYNALLEVRVIEDLNIGFAK